MSAKVSFVIPCYNAQRFLRETVDSVLAQDYRNCEVILIDDGSTDNTAELIRAYKEKVRAEFGPNRGVSAARNRGTALARGDYIQYVDADDLLRPGTIKARIAALEETGADVAYADWQHLEEQDGGSFAAGELVTRSIEDVGPDPAIALFTSFWSPPAAIMYRRGIVDRIGQWNESLPIVQDARFLLDAALQGAKFVHVVGVGADYRVHRGPSVSRKNSVAFVRDCLLNASQIEQWFLQHGGITTERCQALITTYEYVARASYETDKSTFEAAYAALIKLKPGYRPTKNKPLALLSAIVGYRTAEELALRYRRCKAAAFGRS